MHLPLHGGNHLRHCKRSRTERSRWIGSTCSLAAGPSLYLSASVLNNAATRWQVSHCHQTCASGIGKQVRRPGRIFCDCHRTVVPPWDSKIAALTLCVCMRLSAQTVLVTGGLGFIGSHTVETLLERGYQAASINAERHTASHLGTCVVPRCRSRSLMTCSRADC